MTTIKLLTSLGILVNVDKSSSKPLQKEVYLGQVINLKNMRLEPQLHKLKIARQRTRRLLKANTMVPAIAAGVAGTLLDLEKSVLNLHGIPKCLMRLVGLAVRTSGSWYRSCPKPSAMKDMLRTVLQVLNSPTCRLIKPHPAAQNVQTTSDASDLGWGGYLRNDQGFVTARTQMLWTAEEGALHSTKQETLVQRGWCWLC